MTTITNTIVVESTSVDFAVDVIYRDLQQNTTNTTSVVNTEAHGESRGVVAGLVMSKYTWDKENVRIHPVGRDVNTGRFVSLKETKEEIIKEAITHYSDLLGLQVDNEMDTQLSNTTSQIIEDEIEKDITVVEECIFQPEEILNPEKVVIKAAKRIKGSKALPVVEIPKPQVILQPEEEIVITDVEYAPMAYDPSYDMHTDMEYVVDDTYADMVADFNRSVEESVVYEDENVSMKTREEIIREVTVITYKYFNKECTLKSFNRQQIRQQMTFIYRKRMQHLFMYDVIVGKVISYLIEKLASAFESKGFTFTYKAAFDTRLVEVCKHINATA